MSFSAPAALAQDGLQLNVPYVCPDGSTYVVHSCTSAANGEFCNYQRDQNSERYNRRTDVANQMKTCKVRGAATAVPASAGGGDYTADLPSVQRVESAIEGKDATDTLERQIAAFQGLSQYIDTVKGARSVRGPYTDSEAKLRAAYQGAANQIAQSYAKSHTPAQAADFNRAAAKYIFDQGLYNDYHRLIGPQAAAANQGAQAKLDATAEQARTHTEQMMNPKARTGAVATSASSRGGNDLDQFFAQKQAQIENDPQVRRCLELGGGVDECEGTDVTGMAATAENLVSKLVGVDPNAGRPTSGVLLVGQYHSRTELPEVLLTWDGKAVLQKCGTLVDAPHAYSLRKSSAATQVAIANEPSAIVLTVAPNGALNGPGSISVKGQVITGYRNQSSCPAGTPAANCKTISTPVYAPSMQRCALSQLAPQPAPPPAASNLSGLEKAFGLTDRAPTATVYGLRMVGNYVSNNGMKLAFSNGFVTVDCGKAHVNAPYTVESTPSGFAVHVQNAGGPFNLTVAQDNTLHGTGSVTVNGKLVSSFHDENVSFISHPETCSVGMLAPTN
jgi:hypothetical protein